MCALALMPGAYRQVFVVALLVILAGGSAALAWQMQAWRYGRQLEAQARLQAEARDQFNRAQVEQQRTEQARRLALEQRLQASEQQHYREMSDVQRDQARLRDRLATADLRLSVLVERSTGASAALPATAGAGGVDHGAVRARLDPAHARRIIAITDDGDRALITLQACQAYVRGLLP